MCVSGLAESFALIDPRRSALDRRLQQMAKVVRSSQEISKLRFRLTCPIGLRHAARLVEAAGYC
jgi:hypothetical protein